MVMVSLKTGLWFIHGNIQDMLVWIVVALRLAILSLGVLLMLSYVSSVAVTCFGKKCNRNRKMENVNRKYGKEQYVEK